MASTGWSKSKCVRRPPSSYREPHGPPFRLRLPNGTPDRMAPWEFWIDVGGTFTDSFARRADGRLDHYKMLSTGVVKGAVADGSSRTKILDPSRAADPPDIWSGFRLRLVDAQGRLLCESAVAHFDPRSGTLGLASPLTEQPRPGQAYELVSHLEAPIVAIRYLLGLPLARPMPPVTVRLGTTRGTNALITRRGAKTALVTTRGFGDILHIGYQNRPRLFDLAIRKPQPLFAAVVEIDERLDADGRRAVRARSRSRRRATGGAALAGNRVAGHLPAARVQRRPARRAGRQRGPRARLRRDQHLQPCRAAGEDRFARRYDRGGRLPESRLAAVRAQLRARSCLAARCAS